MTLDRCFCVPDLEMQGGSDWDRLGNGMMECKDVCDSEH